MTDQISHKARQLLLLTVLVAVILRICGSLSAPPPQKDAREYERLASHLAAGRGFTFDGKTPTAARPPGYPTFVAAIYKLSGDSRHVVRVIEACLGGLTCLILFYLARYLFNARTGLVASALWAVNPLTWDSYFAAGTFCMETLVALLFMAALAALYVSFRSQHLLWSTAAGFLLGITLLTKASLILLPLLLAPLWFLQAFRSRSLRPLLNAVVTGAICLACLTPWIYRNYTTFDAFVPVSTGGGFTFYRSNNEFSDGGHNYPNGGERQFDHLPEIERNNHFYDKGRQYLRDHSDKIPWLVYRKNRLLMDPFYISRLLDHRTVVNVWLVLLAPLGVIGFLLTIRSRPWWTLIVLAAVTELVLVTSLFHGYARYRFPFEPILTIYASIAIASVWAGCQRKARQTHAAER